MIRFEVHGLPAPQGSKKAVGRRKNGSTILIEMSRKVRPWREAVEAEARRVRPSRPIMGAVVLRVTFCLRAPQKMPRGRVWPTTTPDLSKLVRSTEDAITTGLIWGDDSQVIGTWAEKIYVGQEGALREPGAIIEIHEIEPVTGGHTGSILDTWLSYQRSTTTPENG